MANLNNSSNKFFQGIECTVFLHEPRSLSEIKEGYATKIGPS